ncbi:MAG: lysylphosphatidylglycerol synthase domain-containing protein [Pseudomonadota bacterium]
MGRFAGYLGTAIAFGFIGWFVYENWDRLPTIDLLSPNVSQNVGFCLFFYLLTQILASIGWRYTLGTLGKACNAGLAESELLVSQIGKYIPGNIAHLIGRISLARTDGIPGWAASLAMFLEICMLLAIGMLYVAVLMIAMPDVMAEIAHELQTRTAVIYSVAALFLVLLTAVIVIMLINRRKRDGAMAKNIQPVRLLGPVAIHIVNNLLLGISLYFAARAVAPTAQISVGFCTIVFVTAWVSGFLTPGSPGGLGVRDGIIALGLGMTMGGAAGLSIAFLHRGVSVVGDVISFGLGLCARKHFATKSESRTS